MEEFELIDSHQHVFWHGRDDAGLIADMDAHPQKIEKSWLLTWDEPGADANNVDMAVIDPRHKHLDSRETMIPLHPGYSRH